jgi:hypothetical protein
MFEHKSEPILAGPAFLWRLVGSVGAGLGLVSLSLLLGMAGYHYAESLGWMDAFLNASMLLAGMGPIEQPQTEFGKLFAGLYALYSGLVVLLIAGVIFAPVIHRFFHKLHLELPDDRQD